MTSNWQKRKLWDLVKTKSGDSKLIKGKQSNSPKKGLYQGYSASGGDVWVEEAHYDCPGVVVSAVGARCGKTFFASGKWTAIANTHVILPGSGLNPKWLWYLTNDESFWVKGGSAQPFVKVKETLQGEYMIPPIAEQNRIVHILSTVQQAIDLQEQTIQITAELLTTLRYNLMTNQISAQDIRLPVPRSKT